jgi:hypothetical protein
MAAIQPVPRNRPAKPRSGAASGHPSSKGRPTRAPEIVVNDVDVAAALGRLAARAIQGGGDEGQGVHGPAPGRRATEARGEAGDGRQDGAEDAEAPGPSGSLAPRPTRSGCREGCRALEWSPETASPSRPDLESWNRDLLRAANLQALGRTGLDERRHQGRHASQVPHGVALGGNHQAQTVRELHGGIRHVRRRVLGVALAGEHEHRDIGACRPSVLRRNDPWRHEAAHGDRVAGHAHLGVHEIGACSQTGRGRGIEPRPCLRAGLVVVMETDEDEDAAGEAAGALAAWRATSPGPVLDLADGALLSPGPRAARKARTKTRAARDHGSGHRDGEGRGRPALGAR